MNIPPDMLRLLTIADMAETGRLAVNDCATATNEREMSAACAVVRGYFIAISDHARAGLREDKLGKEGQ